MSGYLISWLQIKKIITLKCCLLLSYATTMDHFSIRLWRSLKSGFSQWIFNRLSPVGLRRHSKALPKAKLAPKKKSWSLWWSAARLIHCNFLNPDKTITFENYAQQTNEMPPKLQCLQLALVNRKSPILQVSADLISHNQCFKRWMNWAMNFCFIHHIHLTSSQLATTSSSILITFCRENASTVSRRQKILSKSSLNPEAWIFMLQKYTNLFFIGKNVLIVMVSVLINKDVFEPSYNDLKFMVWNNNYFCTNLMTPYNTLCAGTLVKNVFSPGPS